MTTRVNGRKLPTAARRSGYTLLESLLALSLLLVLMVTVITATSLFMQFRSQAADRILPAFSLTSLLEDIGSDLRSAEGYTTEDYREFDASQSEVFDSQIGERVLNIDISRLGSRVHFVGNESAFVLVRLGSNSRFYEASSPLSAPRQSVLWIGPDSNEVRLATHRSGKQTLEHTIQRPKKSSGLVRTELDVKNQVTSANSIEEVSRIAFRYFDGRVWHSKWNSYLKGNRLPHAVEIILELKEGLASPFRTVICIPAGTSSFFWAETFDTKIVDAKPTAAIVRQNAIP